MAIEIKGLKEAADTARRIALHVPTDAIDGMAQVAYAGFRSGAGRHSPRPQGTGNLFASLFHRGVGTLLQSVGHDGTRAPYAEFVIFGSVPHEILPRKAKMLSWIGGPGFDRRIFAHRVWHPGYAGDNYRDPAERDALAALPGAIDRSLRGL